MDLNINERLFGHIDCPFFDSDMKIPWAFSNEGIIIVTHLKSVIHDVVNIVVLHLHVEL